MKQRMMIIACLVLTIFCVATANAQAQNLRIGVVLSIGGLGDESFNDAAYEGVVRLRKETGCVVEVIEPGSISGIEPALRYFCERNLDLVCAVGIFANDAVRRAAEAYPQSRFLLLDSVVTLPNVLSVLFDEEQGSFYAGAFAGLVTRKNVVGFLGGMDSPVIAGFERGFKNGVKFVNPDATVVSRYIGVTPEAFDMPDKASALGLEMAAKNADLIYHASGKSGLGLIRSAGRGGYSVIGVDSDQSRSAPGKVPASMVKRLDNALMKAVEVLNKGTFTGGIWTLGLQDRGIDLALSRFNRDLITPEVNLKLREVEKFLLHRDQ